MHWASWATALRPPLRSPAPRARVSAHPPNITPRRPNGLSLPLYPPPLNLSLRLGGYSTLSHSSYPLLNPPAGRGQRSGPRGEGSFRAFDMQARGRRGPGPQRQQQPPDESERASERVSECGAGGVQGTVSAVELADAAELLLLLLLLRCCRSFSDTPVEHFELQRR
ncbi:hypothetical protein MARPO_0021s0109 [Marchantia polymorpha]|uniref:Uncharacterized protein n=1 Tax=Marchantia polymorpha TaxID=3197 RepID=A0A2R6XDS0_MARPO|nr:hypothetical protein MARPO_0021s0109 [Marchantia polymorpha]|eukprot:PTQ44255.1 hypothetical protein MARPO_0021s0109 [Marchantia polymorpha]